MITVLRRLRIGQVPFAPSVETLIAAACRFGRLNSCVGLSSSLSHPEEQIATYAENFLLADDIQWLTR
jgi:hypothetical protein